MLTILINNIIDNHFLIIYTMTTDDFLEDQEFQQHYLLPTVKCYFCLFHGTYVRNSSVTALTFFQRLFTTVSVRGAVLLALLQQEV